MEELPKLKSDWPLEPLKTGQDITNLKGELNDTLLPVGFQKRCSLTFVFHWAHIWQNHRLWY